MRTGLYFNRTDCGLHIFYTVARTAAPIFFCSQFLAGGGYRVVVNGYMNACCGQDQRAFVSDFVFSVFIVEFFVANRTLVICTLSVFTAGGGNFTIQYRFVCAFGNNGIV